MDIKYRKRLASEVKRLRGTRSHRVFAPLVGVAPSTISGWESCKNIPNLENLEKLSELASLLPEVFLARLYGRDIATRDTEPVAFLIQSLDNQDIGGVLVAIAKKIAGGE